MWRPAFPASWFIFISFLILTRIVGHNVFQTPLQKLNMNSSLFRIFHYTSFILKSLKK
ncbi:hypothetical protein HMPREF9182_0389 [Streptococcus sp. oral taxon 056 str. F0418]|nr:hypothetical protein HMPREF9182_0389 [Streptococcus sp. oral taxon 056 str. F0418]